MSWWPTPRTFPPFQWHPSPCVPDTRQPSTNRQRLPRPVILPACPLLPHPTTEDFWFNSSVLTGIEEGEGHSVSPSVTAGPNPSAGSFSVSAAGFFGNAVYGVYSLDGRLITSSTSDTGGVTINGSQLPAGVYTIVVTDETGNTASCRMVRF